MFFEYALEPELVAQWCDRTSFAAFMQRFGIDARRIVSRFPKRWERSVEDAFLQKYPSPSFAQKQRKTQIISYLTKRMVRRGSTNFKNDISWLENAEVEHTHRPFGGIVASSNPRRNNAVVVVCSADDILEKFDQLPQGTREVARTANEMSSALAPLLRCCEVAVFVDPHFDAVQRFLAPFRLFMDELVVNRVSISSPQIQLHVAVVNQLNPALELHQANQVLARLGKALPMLIPRGHDVRIVVWKEKLRGQKLHNRYLLTDIGSVSLGTGLDCNDESFNQDIPQAQTDDIFCLSEIHQDKRWCEYVTGQSFEKVNELVIAGNRIV
ncbi:hypothetical protein [Geomonas azotofigens]|uniref:hypothetical protein n=1 Tax=Geomonas azotofigens TaxID=2843196 RepID=UPI001C127DCC|nr:hypothetical protein [Geomonas azotofigens]MBU5614461.1 hypothetical protein [Geomonas azotofigens]